MDYHPPKRKKRGGRRKPSNRELITTYECDKMRCGQHYFVRSFPEYKGKKLVFSNIRNTQLPVDVARWLEAAGIL
jgi:hypothetical protein